MSRQFALGCIFRTCRNFWESTDLGLVLSQKFLQIQNLHRNPFDCDCANANQLRISTNLKNNSSLRDSAQSAESWQYTFKNAESTRFAESTNKTQQTIEAIAVEVVGFLDDFGRKARLKSAQCPKSSKSPQDAPKSKLQQDILQKAIVRDFKH